MRIGYRQRPGGVGVSSQRAADGDETVARECVGGPGGLCLRRRRDGKAGYAVGEWDARGSPGSLVLVEDCAVAEVLYGSTADKSEPG